MAKIIVTYRSCDGCRVQRTYKTLTGARKFAQHYVGKHPDFGLDYAVSFDGIGTIRVQGATLSDLFPAGESSE